MRKFIFNLHLYLALMAAAFVIIMGLTGSIMAFQPELDRLLHRRLMYVPPGEHALSFAEIAPIVAKAFPGDRVQAFYPSTSPELSCHVNLENSGTVYLNPYTGQILGVRPDEMEFLDYVTQLHIRLAWQREGDPGKKIMSWMAVALLFLLLSGLVLWWPQKRVSVRRGARGRLLWFDLHNAVGIFSLLFLLTLTVTGIMMGFERTTEPLLYKLTGSQPTQMPDEFPPAPPGAKSIRVEQATEAARIALPGAVPFAIMVTEAGGPYRIFLRYPEDRTSGPRSIVIVDRYSGHVIFAQGSRIAPAGERLVNATRAIHGGDIFGIPSKIVMSLASLLLVLQAISGLIMWWKRIRATRRTSSLAAAKGAD